MGQPGGPNRKGTGKVTLGLSSAYNSSGFDSLNLGGRLGITVKVYCFRHRVFCGQRQLARRSPGSEIYNEFLLCFRADYFPSDRLGYFMGRKTRPGRHCSH